MLGSPVGSAEYMQHQVTERGMGPDPDDLTMEERAKSNCLLAKLAKVDQMPPERPT